MKNSCFLAAAMMTLISCKDKSQAEGFIIKGTLNDLPEASMALLSYTENEVEVVDSVPVKNGAFSFEGKVDAPAQAYISIRHGDIFPEASWDRDTFHFFIENTEMRLVSKDSIKRATLEGSLLNAEADTLNSAVSPLRQKIQELSFSLQGKPKDSAYMATVDTIKATGEKAETTVREFIENHRNSYIALRAFANYEMGYDFDPAVAEREYDQFGETIKNTPLGKKVSAKIALAKKTAIGQKVIDFTQENLSGEAFTLSSLRGKYVLVDFWASWCVPCRMENPHVLKAYEQFGNQNFEIVGVSLDEKRKNWEHAIEKDGLPWIHVSDLKGWKNEVAQQYGVTAVPQNLLIDPEGIIVAKNLRGEELSERLSAVFN
ncbi:TlpA disulfide reductase family protein [Sinomicrobium soli]|uniref:TlpA disulfide reductase family protein n=1 Tax=Sinomicrobium sp. N-1-3-6 TaxID=2219864 RepID=UPI000DCF47BD|nr:TlpA disulfide reductase family protein [Sinomicrobium sp. N-1-3-6]RAV28484.1 AhpC/TSA family protein [Sinomicrobium sp. N-1-3-6]